MEGELFFELSDLLFCKSCALLARLSTGVVGITNFGGFLCETKPGNADNCALMYVFLDSFIGKVNIKNAKDDKNAKNEKDAKNDK